MDIEELVQQIGREYVEKRMEIEVLYQYEFDTTKNREAKQHMIDEVERSYREKLREKKIEHLFNDTILGRQIENL